ncbi:MAG: NlpC/P60 family protein [Enterococcus sp.]|uniref:C40 family peptidase n=3 Tax=Enterococcus sp. TaxID=35783 RepID=UPI002FCBFA20
MASKVLTRRELRQQKRQKSNNYRYLKKGSAVLGTALVTVSVVAPLLKTHQVKAVEDQTTATTSNADKKAFIEKISKEIQPLADKHDLYASVIIAQAIIESNWGQNEFAQAPYNNLFGLEGQYQGQSAVLDKTDSESGLTQKKELKKYGSFKEAVQDYIEILKTTSQDGKENYFSGTWRSNAQDYQSAAQALEGRFNKDQSYVQKLVSTIQENNLTTYDATEPVTAPVAQTTQVTTSAPQQYTVQSGDTVNSITDQFGIGVKEFTDWNSITDNNIYAGQTVVVGNGEAAQVTNDQVVTPPVVTDTSDVTTATDDNTLLSTTLPTTDDTVTQLDTPSAETAVEVSPAAETTPVQQEEQTTTNQDQTVSQNQTTDQIANQNQATDQGVTQEQTTDQNQVVDQTATTDQTGNQNQAADQTATTDQTANQNQVADQTATTDQTGNQNQAADQTATTDQTANQNQAADQTQQTSQGQQIVNEAEKYIGTQYVWGGKDPSGFDCSGLTQYVYKQVTGENIGSWTVAQESSGTQIAVSDAQAGDLLFWGDRGATYHVAISAGGDQYIHAPQPGQTVTYGSTQYYTPDFGVRVN